MWNVLNNAGHVNTANKKHKTLTKLTTGMTVWKAVTLSHDKLACKIGGHTLLWFRKKINTGIHKHYEGGRWRVKLPISWIIIIIIIIIKVIKSRRLRWQVRIEEGRSTCKILTGSPTGKRPLERPRRKWENNIRIYLEEIGINAGNWVDSAQDRDYWRALVNASLILRVP